MADLLWLVRIIEAPGPLDGHGIPTREGLEPIRQLAERDGVLLDPTYTSKAMAALIADVRSGGIAPDETIVFLHTGGAPALFAHADRLVTAFREDTE